MNDIPSPTQIQLFWNTHIFIRNESPLDTEDGYLNYLQHKLSTIDASNIAAIIIEPVIGEGGYILHLHQCASNSS